MVLVCTLYEERQRYATVIKNLQVYCNKYTIPLQIFNDVNNCRRREVQIFSSQNIEKHFMFLVFE